MSRLKQILKIRALIILSTIIIIVIYVIYGFINLNVVRTIPDNEVEELIVKYTKIKDGSEFEDGNSANRLIIPKIGVNLEIFNGDDSVLSKGIWHRLPQRGDPLIGGNFILSGHRFRLGLTPDILKQSSPLYHIEKLEIEDTFVIIWERKAYEYVFLESSLLPRPKMKSRAS